MHICPKCKVELKPCGLNDEKIVGTVATFNGSQATLKGLSRTEGFICPKCPDIFAFNGSPTPIHVVAIFSSMIDDTYVVDIWRPVVNH